MQFHSNDIFDGTGFYARYQFVDERNSLKNRLKFSTSNGLRTMSSFCLVFILFLFSSYFLVPFHNFHSSYCPFIRHLKFKELKWHKKLEDYYSIRCMRFDRTAIYVSAKIRIEIRFHRNFPDQGLNWIYRMAFKV